MRHNELKVKAYLIRFTLVCLTLCCVFSSEKAFAIRLVIDQNTASSTDGIDWSPYMADLKRRLKIAWRQPLGHEAGNITVSFTIKKNGQVTDPKIQKSSGVSECNNAAINAVKECSPQALPATAGEKQDFQFTFDQESMNRKPER
jgi:TonB family protein